MYCIKWLSSSLPNFHESLTCDYIVALACINPLCSTPTYRLLASSLSCEWKVKHLSHFSENKLDPNQPFVVFGNFTVFVPAFRDDGSQMCWLLHRCDGIATNLQYNHTCILRLVVKTLSRHIIEAVLNNYKSVEWSVFPWNGKKEESLHLQVFQFQGKTLHSTEL